MRTAHLEEHAVVNHAQVTVQEPGAENRVTVRIRRRLRTKPANQSKHGKAKRTTQ